MEFKDMENIYNEVYESPIVVDDLMDIGSEMISEINKNVEDSVVKSVHKIGINVDKEELIRALSYDRKQYEKGYECGYNLAIKNFKDIFESTYGPIQNCYIYPALESISHRMKTQLSKNKGWISVNDMLPKESEDVLLWFEYFRYGNYNCMYSTYGIGWQIGGNFHVDGYGNVNVFAWMPLPEPPKK